MGICNVRSLFRSGSVTAVGREVAKCRIHTFGCCTRGYVRSAGNTFDKNLKIVHLRNWEQRFVED